MSQPFFACLKVMRRNAHPVHVDQFPKLFSSQMEVRCKCEIFSHCLHKDYFVLVRAIGTL